MALTDNLLASWSFNGNFLDNLGVYNGTAHGDAQINTTNPMAGSGDLLCGGNGGWVETALQPAGAQTALTLRAVIQHDTGANNDGICGWASGATGFMIQTRASGNPGLLVFCSTNGSQFGQVDYDIVSAPCDVVMVYDGSLSGNANRLKLYINGVLQTLTFSNTIPSSITLPTTFAIGDIGPNYGRYWDGKIDEVAGWQRALTQLEVNALYNGGSFVEYDFSTSTVVAVYGPNVAYQQLSGTASVTIEGGYIGSPPELEYRVKTSGGTPVTSWATLDGSPSGGTFSVPKDIAENRSDLVVEVRFSNDASISADSDTFLVGDGILGSGQSNMEHQSDGYTAASTPTESGGRVYYNGTWRLPQYKGEVEFLDEYISKMGRAAFLINMGVSSSGLHAETGGAGYWIDPTAGAPYDLAISAVNALTGGYIAGILWIHAETDVLLGISTTIYSADFATLASWFRADLINASGLTYLPIVVTTLNNAMTWPDPDITDITVQAYRVMQMGFDDPSNNIYASMASHLETWGDFHYSNAGYQGLGVLEAQPLLYAHGKQAYYQGPVLASAVYSGTSMDINITHDGGSTFTPSSGLTQFEVFDNGSPINVNAAVRLNSTTIRLTLASAPTGPVTVRYLYGKNPDNSGAVVDDVGLPLLFFNEVTANEDTGTSIPARMAYYRRRRAA